MSRTYRRKNSKGLDEYLFNERNLNSLNTINIPYDRRFNGLTLRKANSQRKALFHSCRDFSTWYYHPNKLYRSRGKHAIRNQVRNSDYEDITMINPYRKRK